MTKWRKIGSRRFAEKSPTYRKPMWSGVNHYTAALLTEWAWEGKIQMATRIKREKINGTTFTDETLMVRDQDDGDELVSDMGVSVSV